MTLKITENDPFVPGVSMWVEDVPTDFTDADVRFNVEQWAAKGDRVAQRALALLPGYWLSYSGGMGWPRTRVYVDE